ncbi:MAG: FAD-dependent oxidoreductase [Planctomycetota bacterium]
MMLSSMLENLPSHLRERSRLLDTRNTANGDFVLYWMCSAVRAEENPALDAAKLFAQELKLPLLVYHGLSERYRFASDRHHRFILEGARDVQQQLQEQGISYAFCLERGDKRDSPLAKLGQAAAVIVTEDAPTQPQRGFTKALARNCGSKLVFVNTACIVPPQLVGKAYDRAFAYRNITKKLYAERIGRAWPGVDVACQPFEDRPLGFEPVDFKRESLAELIAACEIDHSVGPVLDTRGGSSYGYQRWNQFLEKGIKLYAKRRNNALLDGVSRMSAYLHYGMVSPFRLAREANEIRHESAEKYLDELLIWRELAFCFCLYRKDHNQWSALPDWAKETLMQHAGDPRTQTYSWEELARGETSDPLWNAAQKSLLIHGELHNNVRMTWGKALLNWLPNPMLALDTIIDLNHRYALDGRDPASYGGILWCLGQFDRPFQPEQEILGSVRPRPSDFHAQRLDPAKYAQKTSVSRSNPTPKIAVIGAGLSGSFAARTLRDHGLPVTVFEKSRGAGGRMATRRTEQGNFDHGAQYFTARDERFRRYIDSWIEQGIVAQWNAEIVSFDSAGQSRTVDPIPRYVGVPAMNSMAKHLASGIDIQTQTQVAKVQTQGETFEVLDKLGASLGVFDRVVVTAPAEQSRSILREFPELTDQFASIQMLPCWATMVQLDAPLPCSWQAAFVNQGPLRWIARNSSKPERDQTKETLVLHANSEWTQENLERDPDSIAAEMLDAFGAITGLGEATQEPTQLFAHRWRYSIPAETTSQRCFAGAEGRLVACGDWAGGPRVEGAFLSGMAAAGRILQTLPYQTESEEHEQLSLFT